MDVSTGPPPGEAGGPPVHPVVERLAAYGWRLLVIGAALVAILWLLAQLWVGVLAVVVALYLARALDAPVVWMRAHRIPPPAAATVALAVVVGTVAALGWILVPRVADEFRSLDPTLTEAVDDVERWLVEDAPFDLSQREVDDLRRDLGDAIGNTFRSSGDRLVSGALVAVEIVTGLILALVTTFFLVKDGPGLQSWAVSKLPEERQELAARLARRAWATLGGYLRGVALLGTVEAAIIGVTVAVVGADLVWPVALLTFLAAFVPIVGAVVAGVVAVLVTLATAGFGAAVVVAVVALAVQQLDNDVLAPVIYGHSLQLHPLVVLFAVLAGGALFGFAGTVLAVPVTAIAVNLATEARRDGEAGPPAADGPS